MTASELGQEIGLAKQTAHRLCMTLEAEGFLVRHGVSKRFVPARRTRTMASSLMYATQTQLATHQILEDVSRQVRETVNFVVPEESGMRYLDRVETDWPFRVQFPIGTNVPFHCTASGKTFMASMPPKNRRHFVNGLSLNRHTPQTRTDPMILLDDLKRVSRMGYAVDDQKFIEGMVAIAVPVRDPDGRFVAALAFHGPVPRITVDIAVAKKDILQYGADRLSHVLFNDQIQ
jgi:DNA-binding IclR family transcriptional regulator